MATKLNPIFELTKDTYREKDHSSITELSRAQALEGSKLSSIVTHMYFTSGSWGKQNFPMLYSTEGMGKVRKVTNFDYTYGILGRPKTTSVVAKSIYTTGDTPGVGRQTFEIPFADKWFAAQQTIHAKGQVSARIQGEPRQSGNMWLYRVTLWSDSAQSSCPLNVLQAGTVWSAGAFKAPFEDSYGVVSKSYLGGKAQNMTSLVRKGYRLKGNVQNKIMLYTIKADGQTFQYYCDWEMYLADIQFRAQQELEMWTSKYGRDAKGEFLMYDEKTGNGIPSNGGIEQQVPNKDSFSYISYKKLFSAIRDVTFNVQDAVAQIDLVTGTGGTEDFDKVMKNELKGFALVDSRQFATGKDGSYDLVYGGFFKSFRHNDGMMVNVIKHPMFDRGYLGDISASHPNTGLPVSSYDYWLLDKSVYDGEANFQYVMEEGREYVEWSVLGSIIPKGFTASDSRASGRDSSEVHGMKSQGIQIMKPVGCFKLECILGQ